MSVDYLELWKEICFLIEKHKHDDEKEFQIVAESIFEKLGWKQYLGEISKPALSIGSSNTIIPDIVIKKDNDNIYVVELKKVGVDITDRNIEQLKSYMRQLKLNFGLIIGKSIKIFFESSKDKEAKQVCEADFNEDNRLGPQIIEQLSKFEYAEEKLESFCIKKLKEKTNEEDIRKKVEYLCSDIGIKYIKELLSIEYPSDVIEQLRISIVPKNTRKPSTGSDSVPKSIPLEWRRRPSESTQNWVKRFLPILLMDGYITDNEIINLHDKKYSQDVFYLDFPLLCDRETDAIDPKGHHRYWLNWKLQNKYFVCSQWWKQKENIYQEKIYKWMSIFL